MNRTVYVFLQPGKEGFGFFQMERILLKSNRISDMIVQNQREKGELAGKSFHAFYPHSDIITSE